MYGVEVKLPPHPLPAFQSSDANPTVCFMSATLRGGSCFKINITTRYYYKLKTVSSTVVANCSFLIGLTTSDNGLVLVA